jgi:diadenosine tetraphosphate (Ap4A) HIT family hydrolase
MALGTVKMRDADGSRVTGTASAYDPAMPTIFTRIIQGELPGRFVWRDDTCVAFLSINPIQIGHTLVVPIAEVDRWTDLAADTVTAVMSVAHTIARAQQEVFAPERVGLVIAGFEVPHCHVHVIPTWGMQDLDFHRAAQEPDPAQLDDAADRLRIALGTDGRSG